MHTTTTKTITVTHTRDLTARWDDSATEHMLVITHHENQGSWTVYRADGASIDGGILDPMLANNYINTADSHATRTWVAERILTAGHFSGTK